MVTLYDEFVNTLCANSFMKENAIIVVDLAKKELPHAIEWDKPVEGVETAYLLAIWYVVRKIALKWIDENQPNAFYRCMFEDAI